MCLTYKVPKWPSMKEYEQSFCIIFYFENMYEILEMFSLFYNLIFFFKFV